MPVSRRRFAAGAAVGLAAMALPGLSSCAAMSDVFKGRPQRHFDVIVVGAGAAGLCAAITAHDAGAEVLVLEKAALAGGNSELIESGINAAGTHVQQASGIEDSVDAFFDDTLKGGHYAADEALVYFMCAASADAISWLEQLGLQLPELATLSGMSVARTHRPADLSALGARLIPVLLDAIQQREIPLVCGVEVRQLTINEYGECTGVVATDYDEAEAAYTARSVVLATGGMCANLRMVSQYRPDLNGCTSTNQPSITGDGYMLAEQAGARLDQMDAIQVHPCVSVMREQGSPLQPTLIPDSVRESGAILVNATGKRFFDETSAHPYLTRAILDQAEQTAWLIFDEAVRAENPAVEATYEPRDLVVQGANVADLAERMGIDAHALQETFDEYRAAIDQGAPDAFNRTQSRRTFEGELFAIKVAPGAHCQMGGVRIDVHSRALNAEGVPLPGLFAAGEVTGGIHGQNRLGGNGACDAVVFGRNAGVEAAEYASVLRSAGYFAGATLAVHTATANPLQQKEEG